MKCKHCGEEIASDSVFCEFCGKKTDLQKKRKWIKVTLLFFFIILLGFISFFIIQKTLYKSVVQPIVEPQNMKKIDTITNNELIGTQYTQKALHLELYGNICNDNHASMKIDCDGGEYHYINYTRIVKVHQYNSVTGELVVYGYENNTDKYIGKFEGILTSDMYQGKFTNYKGIECSFSLYMKKDLDHTKEEVRNEMTPAARYVEQMPEFIGGMDALYEFLGKNLQYPETARVNGIQGTVLVEFIIETDGSKEC